MKNDSVIQKRIQAVWEICRQPTLSRKNFNALREIIGGLNPALDQKCAQIAKIWGKIDQIKKQEIIDLTLENLPAKTQQDKKRKKLLLLFLKGWKDLKSEVDRVKTELESQAGQPKSAQAASAGRIAAFAKGPFGVLTAAAAIIAAGLIYLDRNAVEIIIRNNGCQTINPSAYGSVRLPGLKLPNQSIVNGGQTTASIPPITLNVDATQADKVIVTAYSFDMTFDLTSANIDVVFDGNTLMGKSTKLNLGSKVTHSIDLNCRSAPPVRLR
ncbi:hypothetical protein A3B57_00065 [Microgenomates group bacterium RIFCSPLOWO2_01_FULL_47_10]|nr:MAG: hypothetical protein A3B57_00065 [Microgenomates group bacterium RIFCSPLOWO2_01_FULL_47_10]